ncbi:MAG: flagellar filament outer layer protein FlaA [Brevinema sp.]
MKRAYLHSITSYTMLVMAVFTAPLYSQTQGSYVFQNFTLSDFGDGYDAAKSLVWKPKFSEFAVQVADDQNQAGGDQQIQTLGGNPDLERNAARYAENKPDGVSELVGGTQKFVLGVKAEFTKQGYNWIELYPNRTADTADAENGENAETILLQTAGAVENAPDVNVDSTPYRIPFSGKTTDITLWAWGGYYGWWVEAYLRDYLGYQYRIPLGDLLYTGWKQKRSGIPDSVIQSRKRLPATQSLEFEMLKLWSFPSEKVDKFYVYFDLLQHTGIVSTEVFNGKPLESYLW